MYQYKYSNKNSLYNWSPNPLFFRIGKRRNEIDQSDQLYTVSHKNTLEKQTFQMLNI